MNRPESPQGNQKHQMESAMLLHGPMEGTSPFHHEIISQMRNDSITFTVKPDSAILRYGSFLFSSSGLAKRSCISEKMRLLARLLIKVWNITEKDECLLSFLKPVYFDTILEATKSDKLWI